MLKYAQSLISSVFGRKRTREEIEEEDNNSQVIHDQQQEVEEEGDENHVDKKVKTSGKTLYRVKFFISESKDPQAIKKFLQKNGINGIKKAPKWNFAFCNFNTKEEALEMVEKVKTLEFKNKRLDAEYIEEDELDHRNRFKNKKNKRNNNKEEEEEDHKTPAEKLATQVTPLYQLPYEQQLIKKKRVGVKQLWNLKNKMAALNDLSEQAKKQIDWAFKEGLPCEVLDIIPSPEVNGYRTKCEFTIGKNFDGEPTVGFLLGLFREGIVSVLDPSELLNVSDIAKKLAKAMQDYVRQSKYPVYDREEKEGVWRTLMTKTQRTGDIMVVVQIKSEGLSNKEVEEIKKDLLTYWTITMKEERDIHITTLIFQVWNGVSNGLTEKGEDEVLFGDGYIHEEILGCTFRISSNAFFQVNTPACELLYSKCAEWCNIDKTKKTTLLDLCCGTGTIGIVNAHAVDRVIGIEMVPEAIVDAKANAERNGIKNVTYYANKVEDRLDVLSHEKNEEVIAVLDPPRNGVHASVIRAVREAKHIDKVIFISCDAKQAAPNFFGLCRPQSNRFKGVPFKPVRAVSVDLFPHSEPSELMIEFERVKLDEKND
ncbi:unnamed protein product [Cunninghamella blakesleeana]